MTTADAKWLAKQGSKVERLHYMKTHFSSAVVSITSSWVISTVSDCAEVSSINVLHSLTAFNSLIADNKQLGGEAASASVTPFVTMGFTDHNTLNLQHN